MTETDLRARLREAAILPIVTVHDVASALRTVEALAEAGIRAVEIVLRTPAAAEAITSAVHRFPDLIVAAGTVTGPASMGVALGTGAGLMIAPGLPRDLVAHHRGCAVPLIPGALTATEVLEARSAGYQVLKYYPAVASQGQIVLEDYAHVFPDVCFVPTGKIGFDTLASFARLRNVICVGGSWMHAGPLDEIRSKVERSLSIVAAARAA